MNDRIRSIGLSAIGALVVAVAALSVHNGPVAAAPTASDPATHTITVTGTGKVTVVPDVARVNVGFTSTQPSVKAARSTAAATMTQVIAAIKALGIADADVRTVGLNLYPQYANNSANKIVGYQISEQLQVTVRDLDKVGDVVDVATSKGATDVSGISFELADPDTATNQARAGAVAAARTSAEAMARAGNVSLGAVVAMTDVNVSAPYPMFMATAGKAADSSVATPVQPGTQDVTAQVTVVFAIP
jgi:uncharacterized protein YggE